MLGTTTAIIAIDLPSIFERNHSKSEEFGISVMDSGVALITILAGISSRKARPWNQYTQKINICKELYLTIGLSIVPIYCGFVRIVMISNVDYQEHPSEWGVHWNFYTTISLVSIFTVLIRDPRYAMPFAFVMMIAYELCI